MLYDVSRGGDMTLERTARSSEEAALLDLAGRRLPGGVLGNARYPDELAFVIKSAQGVRVRDWSGREYIDYLLGSGPMFLGHAHPAVPCAEQVRFTSTGSEATFFALRAARAFRQRDKIMKFEGGYHGSHDYAL